MVSALPAEKDAGFVLFGRAGSVKRHLRRRGISLHQLVGNKVVLNFFAANIRKHRSVDFDAGRKWLTTLLLHFPPKGRVLDDVLFLLRQIVFLENCPDPIAPSARGFQVGDNLRFIHNA